MSESEFERLFKRYFEGPSRTESANRSLNLVSADGQGGVFIPDASMFTGEQIAALQAALDKPEPSA